jgi:hypothetical protein
VDAVITGDRELIGLEAAFEMVTWTTGSFEFKCREIELSNMINLSTSALLLEGALRADPDGVESDQEFILSEEPSYPG